LPKGNWRGRNVNEIRLSDVRPVSPGGRKIRVNPGEACGIVQIVDLCKNVEEVFEGRSVGR
jgi:hypothetical protein